MRDPYMRQTLKGELIQALYTKPDTQLTQRLYPIARRHAALTNGLEAFRYRCELYWGNTNMRGIRPALLHHELHPIMDEWIAEHKALKNEQGNSESYLASVLMSAHTSHDIRRLLPENLHPLVDFGNWPETGPGFSYVCSLDHFMEQTKESLSQLKQRMVLNLIT